MAEAKPRVLVKMDIFEAFIYCKPHVGQVTTETKGQKV